MSKTFQTGVLAFASGDLSASVVLSTPVTRLNAMLKHDAHGGSNSVGQANFRIYLSADGTTVTAVRAATGSTLTVAFTVIEDPAFTVHHFEETLTVDGTNPFPIPTSVDLDYSFPVYGGCVVGGGTRGEDDIHGIEIASADVVNVEIDAHNSAVVNFQIVEMSATEIASVNLYKVNQSGSSVDQLITTVDRAKTLLFGGGVFAGTSGSDMLRSNAMPTWELTADNNLQCASYSAQSKLTSWVYVVEFNNLSVVHKRVAAAGSTLSEVLSSVPVEGGLSINGILGRFGAANDTDDDSKDSMWSADLVDDTWTLTRGASPAGFLSYSVFDWNDVVPPPTTFITDVDGDEVVNAGQTAAVTVTGFNNDITAFTIKQGLYESPALVQAGSGTLYDVDIIDPTAFLTDTAGPAFGTVQLTAADAENTAEIDIELEPPAGWVVLSGLNIEVGFGSVAQQEFPDGSQIVYFTNNGNVTVQPNGVFWAAPGVQEVIGAIRDPANRIWVPFKVTLIAGGGDTEKPSIPQNVVAVKTGETTANMTWDLSTDNVGVTGYVIYLNGVQHDTVAAPPYNFTGLTPDTDYFAAVAAYDAVPNTSDPSASDSFRTDPEPAPAPVYASYITAINMGPADTQLFTLNTETDPDQWEGDGGSPILPKP